MSAKKTQFKLVNTVLIGAIALALGGCGDESLTSTNNTSPGGDEINPAPPSGDNDSQISSNLVVFTDGANSEWSAWDSSGVTTPAIQVETDQYGAVMEFVVDAPESVFGFVRSSSALDLSTRTGKLVLDVKVTEMPENGDIPWFVKLESNGGLYSGDNIGEEVQFSLDSPVVNQWQRFEIDLAELQSQGLDLSAIDNVLIFPEWGQGAGAVFRVDNVQFMLDSNEEAPVIPEDPAPSSALFTSSLPSGWVTWDCCGETTPVVVDSGDEAYGSALEFIIVSPTVLGVTNRADIGGNGAENLNLSGKISVDIKLLNDLGEGAATNWLLKIESGFEEQFAELPLPSAPPVGTWQRYTFEVADLVAAGLDVTSIDTILIFPEWGTGLGSHFLVDNVMIEGVLDDGSDETPEEPPVEPPVEPDTVTVVDDAVNLNWIAWDCCGGSVAETIDSGDVAYGNAVKFVKNIVQTVLGFSSRDDHGATDANTLSIDGSLSFDMKLLNDGGSSDWKLKVESGPENFVELSLPSLPAQGEWQNYTFDLQSLSSGSLDLTAANVIMVFPAWDTGAGAEYLIDNLEIVGSVNDSDVVEPEEPEQPGGGDTVLVSEGIDFESKTLDWEVFENSDNAALEFVSNPDTSGINTSSTAAKIVAKVAGAPWAGTKTEGVTPFTLDSSNGVIKVMVYKNIISSVVVKVESPDGEGIWGIEERVQNTKVNEWEELTFDFTQNPAFNAAPSQITGVVVFPDFNVDGGGTPLNRVQDVTMYFDNVTFNSAQ
ncbi:hypothetical protein [Vibrio breoganii]|uniref:hypothetical protein n=1 Tax=Vibrio breoganii TaxID=553239 RepID=UPI000C849BA9|nr:hypothetical protein [Vibrio breoganii]PML41855.1 hypothetical protein BCT77_02535 [Vibrio breoganii]PMO73928.1 hypothetical protein BCT02_13350 [Vibrio breoganii]PMO88489.1 hypothetical protein BCS99_07245 [Vibrio breoganii]